MASIYKIRDLICSNEDELASFGDLSPWRGESTGGRPGTADYLKEEQALLVRMFSRTEKAKAVRAEVAREIPRCDG